MDQDLHFTDEEGLDWVNRVMTAGTSHKVDPRYENNPQYLEDMRKLAGRTIGIELARAGAIVEMKPSPVPGFPSQLERIFRCAVVMPDSTKLWHLEDLAREKKAGHGEGQKEMLRELISRVEFLQSTADRDTAAWASRTLVFLRRTYNGLA